MVHQLHSECGTPSDKTINAKCIFKKLLPLFFISPHQCNIAISSKKPAQERCNNSNINEVKEI